MKKVVLSFSLLFCVVLKCYSQGTPVYDVKADLNATMKKIEDKAYKAKDWFYNLQQIHVLVNTFKRMDTLRRQGQAAYDLSYKIYDNTKKVEYLKDFGMNDVAFIGEKLIGMPVDPSFYLIRAKGQSYNKFVKAVSYNAKSNVDQNARDIYDFLLAYDASYGSGEGGNRIGIFDEIAQAFLFEQDWRKMVEVENIKAMAKLRNSINQNLEDKKKQLKLLQKDGKYSMSQAERMEAIKKLILEADALNDSLRKQNAQFGKYIAEKNKKKVLMEVGMEYNRRWSRFNRSISSAKVVGEFSLRKHDKSRRPISKIVYNIDK